jgi:DNA invertase Pin-like site-specific DNA recombinase
VESTRVQLNLREKAIALGWRDPGVIDDDLGLSAGGFAERPGFQELLARVTMRKVGIILCVDASRLSRNSKDWAQLFELCGYFNTLIADLEQIYDLSRSNDKLIMGIKGTVSEMELSILRTRLRSGIEAKAARGELKTLVPVGYTHDLSKNIVKDPDQRIQGALTLLFDQFDRFTSVRQLAMWYHDTKTLFPIKKISKKAPILWEIPTRSTLYHILTHPIYAGAYVWGRRYTRVEYVEGRLVKRVHNQRGVDQYRVCIRDHHPAYISWKRLMENVAKITENRPRWNMQQNTGAIKEGFALLSGLLRCGHCGGKIYVRYKAHRSEAEGAMYFCNRISDSRSKSCISFGSKLIDRRVGEELCKALGPLSIKASIAAMELKEKQRTQEIDNARKQVEATEYESDRAFEQYNLCDPKNRLVASTLEGRLNERLRELHQAKENLEKVSEAAKALTKEQRQRLKDLAQDFPSVWNHPEVDLKLKKRLLRTAIHEILIKGDLENQRLEVTIHWQGGVHTRIYVKKRATPIGNKVDPSLVDLVRKISSELKDEEIARILNMKNIKTTRGMRWTQDRVEAFRHRHHIRATRYTPDPDILTMKEATAYLNISRNGLLGLVKMGAVSKNQITEFAPWKVSKAELDSDYVQGLVQTLKETGRLPKGGCPKDLKGLFDSK